MISISNQHSLRQLNSFGIAATAQCLVTIDSVTTLRRVLQADLPLPYLVLGGGSNLLFTQDFAGTVIKNNILGKEIVAQQENEVILAIGAGENWHQLVQYCLANNLGGLENLALIPGTVGAAPIQNIGAYGVELKDVFVKLEAVALADGKLQTFTLEDCQFAYRHSIFKGELKRKYVITRVYLRLTTSNHRLHTSYGALQQMLAGIKSPTIQQIGAAVIRIRQSKLPDPAHLGNAGSFFKNPELPPEVFAELQAQFPDLPSYPGSHGRIKVPAGWLIERCGWKGKRVGNTGAHKDQALVLVNYGGASGQEIYQLAQAIIASVEAKFGVSLQPEVNIL